MGFRNLIFVRKIVLRNCVRQASQSASELSANSGKGPLLLPAANIVSSHILHARCLSIHSVIPSCYRANQRQTAHNVLFANNAQTTACLLPPRCRTTCQHQRFLHVSDQYLGSKDNKVEETKTSSQMTEEDDPLVAKYDESGKPLSNWKRMKIMMKAYSYVIIPVHWIIAPVWFGTFYYVIKMGVDIGPMLLKIGVSEDHVNSLQNSGASNALMAYALYKIFTPLRYTVTVGATEMTVRYLRRHGYIKRTPPKEKSYRESLQETMSGMKDKAHDVKGKAQEAAQDFRDKAQEIRDNRKKL